MSGISKCRVRRTHANVAKVDGYIYFTFNSYGGQRKACAKTSSNSHGEGRAAHIAAMDGKSPLQWKQEWDQAMAAAEKLCPPRNSRLK